MSERQSDLMGKNPNFPDIEPCAHCGSMPCPPGMYGNGNWGIRCSWCSVMTSDKLKDKAIADWNRRPPHS